MLKSNDIKRTAREVGFDLCGVAQCRDLESDRAFLEGWLERGFGGSLDYLKKISLCVPMPHRSSKGQRR